MVIELKGTLSKSGVFEFDNFRDNLIVDKYDPVFNTMKGSKINQLRSENSEDALTWNVFKSLQQINPNNWFPYLVSQGLKIKNEPYYFEDLPKYIEVPKMLQIKLWQPIEPPPALRFFQKDEGPTEVDIIIESEDFVWFIEAKYKSDISVKTTNNENRDQILRNLDVGTWYAGVRDFYFSLLILDDKNSPKGVKTVNKYNQERITNQDFFLDHLDHRTDGLKNLKEISIFYWKDIAAIFKYCSKYSKNQFECAIAENAFNWLHKKNIIQNINWLEQDISYKYETYPKELELILKVQQFAQLHDNNMIKYFLPKGYDELGFPTKSILGYYTNMDYYWDDYELAYNSFNENGLPWWWSKEKGVEEFRKHFFEKLSNTEELGDLNEDEYWRVFNNDPEHSLCLTYNILSIWYQNR